LAKFKGVSSFDELVKGLRTMNRRMFTLEQVKQVAAFMPGKDDIANLKNFVETGGDVTRLPPAEQFVLKLDQVPFLANRLVTFVFALSFDLKIEEVKSGLLDIERASKQVIDSKSLPQILELILELGNFINDGSPRGGAFGFKLSSLSKLDDIKAADNKTTLLQYLVQMLEKKSPQLLKVNEELSLCEIAARVSMQAVSSDLASLKKDFAATTTFLDELAETEKFPEISAFIAKAKKILDDTSTVFTSTQELFKKATTYLCEDPQSAKPEEFFAMIQSFLFTLNEAIRRNDVQSKNAEKLKKMEEARIKRLKKIGKSITREMDRNAIVTD